jgi:dephospho-CoA kinase
MIVLALTGSIGMGKSTVLQMFKDEGAAVWAADGAVHRLYAKGGAAVAAVKKAFPQAVAGGAVDRAILSALVLNDDAKLRALEAVVHPLVARDREAFLKDALKSGARVAVLDIPLLFETGSAGAFDKAVAVSAPAEIQRARVLARPGMTEAKFAAILKKQMPDSEKRARADVVIETGAGLDATRAAVKAVMAELMKPNGI